MRVVAVVGAIVVLALVVLAPAAVANADITITATGFVPATVTVQAVVDEVGWSNTDTVVHTATCLGLFDFTLAPGGAGVEYVFHAAGTYVVYDKRSNFRSTVIVTPAPPPGPTTVPTPITLPAPTTAAPPTAPPASTVPPIAPPPSITIAPVAPPQSLAIPAIPPPVSPPAPAGGTVPARSSRPGQEERSGPAPPLSTSPNSTVALPRPATGPTAASIPFLRPRTVAMRTRSRHSASDPVGAIVGIMGALVAVGVAAWLYWRRHQRESGWGG